jgi:hypothetical protein
MLDQFYHSAVAESRNPLRHLQLLHPIPLKPTEIMKMGLNLIQFSRPWTLFGRLLDWMMH